MRKRSRSPTTPDLLAQVAQRGAPEHPFLSTPWLLYTDRQRWGYLTILFVVAASQFFDRNIMSVLLEPIRHEFHVSDTMLGLLSGLCFALFYSVAGIPVARWADRGNRRTIITLALAAWSVMTLVCGLAQAFWQLALARVLVGVGESGGLPPSQSLIADYFSPERRATAIASFTAAAIAGNLLGIGVGGYLAATYGWRTALLLAGAAGILLSVLVRLYLAEPRQRLGFPTDIARTETFRASYEALKAKRGYTYTLCGSLLYFLFAYSVLTFIPSYLIRTLHIPLAKASVTYAAVNAVGTLLGTLLGGTLADRLGSRTGDVRWFAWLPALAYAIGTPFCIAGLLTDDFETCMVLQLILSAALSAGLPCMFTAIHAVCGNVRRTTAIAIMYYFASLIGAGAGPLVSGMISDALSKIYGAQSLRYALIVMTALLPVSAVVLYRAGRVMPADVEN